MKAVLRLHSSHTVLRSVQGRALLIPLGTKKIVMPYRVYILLCSDGSYYTGSAANVEKRLCEHQDGVMRDSYTFSRRPVRLVWASEEVVRYSDALRFERQVKGWSRAKKEALIRGDFELIHEIVKAERKKREQTKKRLRAERSVAKSKRHSHEI